MEFLERSFLCFWGAFWRNKRYEWKLQLHTTKARQLLEVYCYMLWLVKASSQLSSLKLVKPFTYLWGCCFRRQKNGFSFYIELRSLQSIIWAKRKERDSWSVLMTEKGLRIGSLFSWLCFYYYLNEQALKSLKQLQSYINIVTNVTNLWNIVHFVYIYL